MPNQKTNSFSIGGVDFLNWIKPKLSKNQQKKAWQKNLQRRTKQKRLDRKICREEQNKKKFQRFNKIIIFIFAKSSRKGMRKSPFSVTSSPSIKMTVIIDDYLTKGAQRLRVHSCFFVFILSSGPLTKCFQELLRVFWLDKN